MRNCANCKHWEVKISSIFGETYGKCTELGCTDMVDIELQTGWDGGYVREIETKRDFSCGVHEFVDGTAKYVIGAAFRKDLSEVVMVLKDRPDWQKGLYNFPGGKIEPGESRSGCMSREFEEECGVKTSNEVWHKIALIDGDGYELHVYTTILSDDAEVRTMESEKISWVRVKDLPDNVIGNIRWLLPYALDHWSGWPGGNVKSGNISYV